MQATDPASRKLIEETVAWAVDRVPLDLWSRLIKRTIDEQHAVGGGLKEKTRNVDAVLIDALEAYLKTPIRSRRAVISFSIKGTP